MRLPLEVDRDSASEYEIARPDDGQIKTVFWLDEGVDIVLDGDDVDILVYQADGVPIGRMICISHASLFRVQKLEQGAVISG